MINQFIEKLKKGNKDFNLRFSLQLLYIFIIVFTGFRLILLATYWPVFSSLSMSKIAFSCLDGLRFDLTTIMLFYGPIMLLINLPIRSKAFIKILSYAVCIELLASVILLSADIVYFGYVNRHIATEIMYSYSDPKLIFSIIENDYLIYAFLSLIAFLLLLWFVTRSVNSASLDKKRGHFYSFAKLLIIIALSALAMRGKLALTSEKPVTAIDAYHYGNMKMGNITLNGVFSAFSAIRHKRYEKSSLITDQEAIAVSKKLLKEDDEEFVSEAYPLLRRRKDFSENLRGYNVVFIVLESWQLDYLDSFAGTHYGATPNFDDIARHGIKFTNFYSAGQRSIHGITSILTSLTEIQGFPFITRGMEVSNIPGLANIMKKIGYSNIFGQAGTRNSQRINNVALLAGFDEDFGEEQLPKSTFINYTQYAPHDYEAMIFFANKLKELKKPFLGLFFSATLHPPFKKFTEDIKKFQGNDEQSIMLNTFYYVDYSLGKLMEKAKEDNWFDDTIFFIMADHPMRVAVRGSTIKKMLHIPMVIYAPKRFEPRKVDFVASQADILPTMIDIMNISDPYTALGKSLFRNYPRRFAFASHNGAMLSFITSDGTVTHNGQKIIDSVKINDTFDVEEAAKKLLALNNSAAYLLEKNKWYTNKGYGGN